MKAKFIHNVLLEFEKGQDPRSAMGIGQRAKIDKWFDELFPEEQRWGPEKPKYRINDDLSIDIDGEFTLPWKAEEIPDFIKFGTIRGDLNITRKEGIKDLDWFPKKIEGDLEFYSNGIRPKKEDLLKISDIEGDIELESEAQKSARQARKRMKERGPLRSRKEHDFRKYPTKPHRYGPRFSKGYKLYQALKAIEQSEPEGMRYIDVIKILFELNYGKGSFDPREHRGWGSAYFSSHGSGPIRKRTTRKENRKYVLNDEGRKYLEEYKDVFEK